MELNLVQEVIFFSFAVAGFLRIIARDVALIKPHLKVLECWIGVGFVMFMCMWCESGNYLQKTTKHYNPDEFVFIVLCFFAVSIATIKRSPTQANNSGALLSREQTEEWKGWMQFVFLLYHYYDAKGWYNLIRCLVSAYAFLTGYGNYLYFAQSKDYSLKRFVWMMWRLNFLTVLLMGVMNEPYILYYIVPVHTIYFCITFAVMGILPSWNDDRWKLSLKIMFSYTIIWFIWDGPVSDQLFDQIFWPLRPLLAMNDSLHEWHFRTYLDHYSTLFGILFAMNLPRLKEFFELTERARLRTQIIIKTVASIIVAIVCLWWYYEYLSMESRFEYNFYHPYFVFIPICGYIFFRNLIPITRDFHMDFSKSFGMLSLETYLLQYHLFLCCHGKLLVDFVPGYRLLNLVVSMSLLSIFAEYIYDWTLQLRNVVCSFKSSAELRKKAFYGGAVISSLVLIALLFTPWVGALCAGVFYSIFVIIFLNAPVSINKYSV
jgi:hypothetical protein